MKNSFLFHETHSMGVHIGTDLSSGRWHCFLAGLVVAGSAVFLTTRNIEFILLISLAGPVFSYLVLETRQGGFLAPVPAVCWSALVFGGFIPSVVITAGTILTGVLCHWNNRSLRNMFISYIPPILLIITAGNELIDNPSSMVFLLPAGMLLQIGSLIILEGIKLRTLLVAGVGWIINAIAAFALSFFFLEDGTHGALLVVCVLVLFAAFASRTGSKFVFFSGRIGTLSLQNRLISYLYREENPYPFYFFDGDRVWTMQGKPSTRVSPPKQLIRGTEGDWSIFPVGKSAFIAGGSTAGEMNALPSRDLKETLLLLESIWRASFAKRRMENAFLGAAGMLVRMADKKDSDTHRHSRRVAQTAVRLGEIMGLPDSELQQLRVGAMLHDIGKLAIPGNLLTKKKLLTESERKTIETHPQAGARLLAPMERYGNVSSVILQHHERIDGTGYPNGLKGSEISLHARIVAVADAFDAIISPRSYHLGKPAHIAMQEISRFRGTHFDALVVDALEEMLL